jgi:small subunit ribosomal protein S18
MHATQKDSPKHIDWKDIETLRKFVNPHGRINAKKHTNLSAKDQRLLKTAIKRARFMGLLPYIER